MDNHTLDRKTRWQAALRAQHALLFDYQTKRINPEYAEYVHCPICNSQAATLMFEKDWFHYVKCQNCSMVYMNPRLNQAATYGFYNSNVNAIYNETKFDQVSVLTALDDHINLSNLNLIDHHRGHTCGNLLEIGCGKGFLLSAAKQRGYNVYGVELNEKNLSVARQLVGETVYNADLVDANFETGLFDVIYMRDVIEHIPNPKPFLRELNRISKPDALLFIETHNIEGLIYKIVRERHTVIFGFEHPNHWSPRTLRHILTLGGFQVSQVIHVSLDFTVADILGYFYTPAFTTIYPPSQIRFRFWVRALLALAGRRPFRWLDQRITPQIANALKRGSVMKVIARKQTESAPI